MVLVAATIAWATIARSADSSPKNPFRVHPKSEQTSYALSVVNTLRQTEAVVPWMPEDVHPVSTMYNREAIIPPQCYTRTEGKYNPCYVCHQDHIPGHENTMNDSDLQEAYSFSETGLTNHWKNLFEDRSERVAAISDKEILQWVNQDNYSALAPRLRAAGFTGWIPEMEELQEGSDAFDEHGFAKDGSHWVAFNYKPVPSTFWPTNGSTDDVMIRLPEKFRRDKQGNYSADIYRANLAILEANIKGFDDMGSLPVDERNIGKDLNGDTRLGTIDRITDVSSYVGAAENEFIDTHLYPQGTEFMHSVRYLGFDENGKIVPSRRMKELRYMKKWKAYRKAVYARNYELESFEKEAGNLPGYHYLGDHGLDNGFGWAIQGFIEDRKGNLRVATYEENFFCMGCHNSIGSTIDKVFSFARKVDGANGWGYIDLEGMPDAPNIGETRGEFATYFDRVGGGGEFRSNDEMSRRWFHPDGRVNHDKVAQAKDVYDLITPSPERALTLNKAYRTIVTDQDFIFGRDATVTPPANVYGEVDNETSPTLPTEKTFSWDIRLDWQSAMQ